MSIWLVESEEGFKAYALSRSEAHEGMTWLHETFPEQGDISMRRLTEAEAKEYEGEVYAIVRR